MPRPCVDCCVRAMLGGWLKAGGEPVVQKQLAAWAPTVAGNMQTMRIRPAIERGWLRLRREGKFNVAEMTEAGRAAGAWWNSRPGEIG